MSWRKKICSITSWCLGDQTLSPGSPSWEYWYLDVEPHILYHSGMMIDTVDSSLFKWLLRIIQEQNSVIEIILEQVKYLRAKKMVQADRKFWRIWNFFGKDEEVCCGGTGFTWLTGLTKLSELKTYVRCEKPGTATPPPRSRSSCDYHYSSNDQTRRQCVIHYMSFDKEAT